MLLGRVLFSNRGEGVSLRDTLMGMMGLERVESVGLSPLVSRWDGNGELLTKLLFLGLGMGSSLISPKVSL